MHPRRASSCLARQRRPVLQVQQIGGTRVRNRIEQTEDLAEEKRHKTLNNLFDLVHSGFAYAGRNVGAAVGMEDVRPAGQLHNERNEVQHRRDAGVQALGQDPVDGDVQHLADAQQIDERPQQRGNERGDDHEQEPVRGGEVGGRGERHAEDAENLRKTKI